MKSQAFLLAVIVSNEKGYKGAFSSYSSNVFAKMRKPLDSEPCTDSFEALVTSRD